MSIDPEYLFDKLVSRQHGRGGYCFQVVTFFAHILRGMGFKHVYTAQARIRLRDPTNGVPGGNYIGFLHAVNIVTLEEDDGTRWSLDVSFGGDGPTCPLPLVEKAITQNIGTQQLRLIRDHIPEQHDKTNAEKLWIYQYRNRADKPWNSYYAFPEIEYTPADLGVANWYTSQSSDSFQTKHVLVVLFLRREVSQVGTINSQGIYGKIMLAGDVVKLNTGGRTEVLAVCNSEVERVRALKEHFGIHLEQEETDGIVGGITEIRTALAE